jgi:hypothetical protein
LRRYSFAGTALCQQVRATDESNTPSAAQTLDDFEKEHRQAESFPVDALLSRQATDPEQKSRPKLFQELAAHEKALIEAALRAEPRTRLRTLMRSCDAQLPSWEYQDRRWEWKICSLKINRYRFKP